MGKYLSLLIAFFFALTGLSCSQASAQEAEFAALRDSLDRITFPLPVFHKFTSSTVIYVETQKQWDNLSNTIKNELRNGNRAIEVKVTASSLVYGEVMQGLEGLNFPDANIRIHANNTSMIPFGPSFKKKCKAKRGAFYVYPYTEFDINDIVIDSNNLPLSLYSNCFQIETPIEEVVDEGKVKVNNSDGSLYKIITKIWRFKTDLPDLSETECKDFYIFMTRHWTSMRHRVKKVENGYLFFYLESEEAPSLYQMVMDPNSDIQYYNTYPRCRYFNSPISDGIHIKWGELYVPKEIKKIKIVKGARLFSVSNCHLNSLEISGFNVLGAGNLTCVFVSGSSFIDQMWVRDNSFSNLSGSAILVINSENVCIYNNTIQHTRRNAISCSGKNVTIWKNLLRNIGFMYNTMALSFGGTGCHILENTIEDFNYSGIAGGGTLSNKNTPKLTFIIERNVIRYSEDFAAHYLEKTVADGGGIYIGPQCTQGIIRNNVVENIKGIHSNRGIFLDDGAKNLAIYGNLIMNTANSYDIDLRLTGTYAAGIPDHNTNNSIFQNIMTGGYRFQDAGEGSNCIGGDNVLLGTGPAQKTVVDLKHRVEDVTENGMDLETAVKKVPVDGFVKKQIKKRTE